ncbi:MAG: Mu-like prophage major head subunit gpT family protein [Gemmataceae bacterium]|nr:Mu-like prophage major head subunit gpT family protein [Gemmataceae bacterium]
MSSVLHLTAPVEIAAADGSKARRFRAVVYTGTMLRLEGFYRPIVIDLKGVSVPRQDNPVLRQHDEERLIGHTDKITVSRQGIEATGIISGVGPAVQEVIALADNGFPWQVSLGASFDRGEQLEPGAKATVNGREFTGPLTITRAITLREISFVTLGADAGSSAIVSNAKKGQKMEEQEIQAAGGTDVSVAAREAAARENQRRTRINDLVATFCAEWPERMSEAEAIGVKGVAESWDPMRVDLQLLRASRARAPAIISRATTAFGAEHIAAALMVKAGFSKAAEKAFGERVMEQSKKLHRAHWLDLCATSLKIDGREVPDGKEALIKATTSPSTGTMPVALGNTANKIVADVYMQAPSAWRMFAAVKSSANFKTQTALRPTWTGALDLLPPNGELHHGRFGEETYTWKIDTFAKQYGIDRRMIIDDDQQVFSDVVPGFVRAAARSLNNLVATVILANSAGGAAFWTLARLNYQEGAGTALSATSLADAIELLRKMKDADGNLLDLEPAALLVPPELEITARGLLQSAEVLRSGADLLPTGNIYQGAAKLAIEPRLSDAGFAGNSAVAWYLLSAPSNASVIVGFLDGQEAPVVETFGLDADINRLAFGFRVYHDFGCALGDFRASIKTKGAA